MAMSFLFSDSRLNVGKLGLLFCGLALCSDLLLVANELVPTFGRAHHPLRADVHRGTLRVELAESASAPSASIGIPVTVFATATFESILDRCTIGTARHCHHAFPDR